MVLSYRRKGQKEGIILGLGLYGIAYGHNGTGRVAYMSRLLISSSSNISSSLDQFAVLLDVLNRIYGKYYR